MNGQLVFDDFEFTALGATCRLHLGAGDPSRLRAAAVMAVGECRRIDERYSRYRDDNLLAEINRAAAAGGNIEIDEETGYFIDYARLAYEVSDGLFDITSGVLRRVWGGERHRLPEQAEIDALLPRIGFDKLLWRKPWLGFTRPGMEIDFGGLGREYAADRVVELCRAQGVSSGYVDLGGDIAVIGPTADGAPWRIGIRDPRRADGQAGVFELSNGGIATSGDYERSFFFGGKRCCHILDPRTGWPAEGLASVSVVAASAMYAGTLSTTAVLKKGEGIAWLRQRGQPFIAVDGSGRITSHGVSAE